MKNKSKEGFTILEVVVVLAVIAIIMAITIPGIKGIINQARATKIASDIRNVQTAVLQYMAVNDSITGISLESLQSEGYFDSKVATGITVELKNSNNEVWISYDPADMDIKYLTRIDKNFIIESGKVVLKVYRK